MSVYASSTFVPLSVNSKTIKMKYVFILAISILCLDAPSRVTAQVSNDYSKWDGVAAIIPEFNNDELSLSWTADKEVNIRWYILERSVNGEDFTVLAMIPARNNYAYKSRYEVDDAEILLQTGMEVRYRLKTVDMNGAQHVSSLVIKKEADGLISSR